jgi:hypothetical protein
MTSEPDSTSRRPPPTIDLKATEVGEKPDAEAGTAQADASSGEPSGTAGAGKPRTYLATALGGIAGGVIGAAAIGSGLWFGGYIPPNTPPAATSAPATNNTAIADIQARLAKIENAPPAQSQPQPQPQQADPALASRLADAEAATKALQDQLAALNGRVDAATGATQDALTQAKAATAAAEAVKTTALGAAQSSVARSDLDALAARVASLDSAIKKLADDLAHQPRSADDRAARLVVAEALRAAVERGAPYQAELAAAKTFGADQSAIAALEPFAATGIPSASALAHDLAALVPALQQAAVPAPADSGFLGRLEANARNLVRITPVDAPVGDDPASVVTRIDVDAARGDIAAALTDIGKLPEAAKSLAAAWAQKAQARQAAVMASQKLAADALAALAKPSPQ